MKMPGITRDILKDIVLSCSGASFVGVAEVRPVSAEAVDIRRRWLADGCQGEMKYLERYEEVRNDPALLLEGTRTIVMAAFSYANPGAVEEMEKNGAPVISEYALGTDYHIEIRRRLKEAAKQLVARYGGECRICVDTAPLRERYWARQAGLGFIGVNNYLCIPGAGAHFCLGALLWTGQPEDGYDSPFEGGCGKCGRCVRACPVGALSADGRLDARKCLSYLTIESREDLPAEVRPGNSLFGCDRCRRACPHEPSRPAPSNIEGLAARPEIISLTYNDWEEMTEERFKKLFKDSPLRRAGLPKLLSTLRRLNRR